MSPLRFNPSFEVAQAANWTCFSDKTEFLKSCPSLMECFYDESLGDVNDEISCHCATIGQLSNDNFPDCAHHSDKTWRTMVLLVINVLTAFGTFCWGAWIIYMLRKLKQLSFNAITQCLCLSIASTVFLLIHQAGELYFVASPNMADHKAFYGIPSISQVTLTVMGLVLVLSDLKIPLLWLQIASSGMNKAEAEKNKKRVARFVNGSGIFFFLTFLGIVSIMGTGLAAMYSILWILLIMVAFNVGSRKLRKQLCKPGEDVPKTAKDIMAYVRRFTAIEFVYIGFVVLFFMNSGDGTQPHQWYIFAAGIYHCLIQCGLANLIYIRMTLDKKLTKYKKNGNQVLPSTTASSMSSASSAAVSNSEGN